MEILMFFLLVCFLLFIKTFVLGCWSDWAWYERIFPESVSEEWEWLTVPGHSDLIKHNSQGNTLAYWGERIGFRLFLSSQSFSLSYEMRLDSTINIKILKIEDFLRVFILNIQIFFPYFFFKILDKGEIKRESQRPLRIVR